MKPISVATIKIAKRPPSDPIEALRVTLDRFAPEINRHDRAVVMIEACIAQGINTRAAILQVANRLGFTRGHVPVILSKETGDNPTVHRWRLDEDGRYVLHG